MLTDINMADMDKKSEDRTSYKVMTSKIDKYYMISRIPVVDRQRQRAVRKRALLHVNFNYMYNIRTRYAFIYKPKSKPTKLASRLTRHQSIPAFANR